MLCNWQNVFFPENELCIWLNIERWVCNRKNQYIEIYISSIWSPELEHPYLFKGMEISLATSLASKSSKNICSTFLKIVAPTFRKPSKRKLKNSWKILVKELIFTEVAGSEPSIFGKCHSFTGVLQQFRLSFRKTLWPI